MPSLPLELERLIFEIAALQETDHDRVRLILVAKRVYQWIRPILFRVAIGKITSQGTITIRNWQNAKLTDVAPFTRHLLVSLPLVNSTSHIVELLSTFHKVENLAIWLKAAITPEVLKKMNVFPLRVLSFGPADMRLDDTIKYCPALRNVTHLEIISLEKTAWNDLKALVEFPILTHLCFEIKMEDGVIRDLLQHCPSLLTMIYLSFGERIVEIDDLRFLVLQDDMLIEEFIEEWESSADGGIGLWELADLIVEARKHKLFKDNTSSVFMRSNWKDGLNEDGIRWYKEYVGTDDADNKH